MPAGRRAGPSFPSWSRRSTSRGQSTTPRTRLAGPALVVLLQGATGTSLFVEAAAPSPERDSIQSYCIKNLLLKASNPIGLLAFATLTGDSATRGAAGLAVQPASRAAHPARSLRDQPRVRPSGRDRHGRDRSLTILAAWQPAQKVTLDLILPPGALDRVAVAAPSARQRRSPGNAAGGLLCGHAVALAKMRALFEPGGSGLHRGTNPARPLDQRVSVRRCVRVAPTVRRRVGAGHDELLGRRSLPPGARLGSAGRDLARGAVGTSSDAGPGHALPQSADLRELRLIRLNWQSTASPWCRSRLGRRSTRWSPNTTRGRSQPQRKFTLPFGIAAVADAGALETARVLLSDGAPRCSRVSARPT